MWEFSSAALAHSFLAPVFGRLTTSPPVIGVLLAVAVAIAIVIVAVFVWRARRRRPRLRPVTSAEAERDRVLSEFTRALTMQPPETRLRELVLVLGDAQSGKSTALRSLVPDARPWVESSGMAASSTLDGRIGGATLWLEVRGSASAPGRDALLAALATQARAHKLTLVRAVVVLTANQLLDDPDRAAKLVSGVGLSLAGVVRGRRLVTVSLAVTRLDGIPGAEPWVQAEHGTRLGVACAFDGVDSAREAATELEHALIDSVRMARQSTSSSMERAQLVVLEASLTMLAARVGELAREVVRGVEGAVAVDSLSVVGTGPSGAAFVGPGLPRVDARVSPRARRAGRRARTLGSLALAAVAFGFVATCLTGWWQARASFSELARELDDTRPVEGLHAALRASDVGIPALGLALPDALRTTAEDAFVRRVLSGPLAALLRADETTLEALGSVDRPVERTLDPHEESAILEALQAHLAFSDAGVGPPPKARGALASVTASRLRAHGIPCDAGCERMLAGALGGIAVRPARGRPCHREGIAAAQRLLARAPRVERELDAIVARASEAGDAITLGRLVGSTASLESDDSVPSVFTRSTYEASVRPALDRLRRRARPWYEGRFAMRSDALAAAVHALYRERQRDAWLRFVRSVRVRAPRDLADARSNLEELTGRHPTPFERLFRGVREHGLLVDAAARPEADTSLASILGMVPAGTGHDLDSSPPSDRLQDFLAFDQRTNDAPSPLDLYLEQLAFLRDALQAAEPGSARDSLLERLETTRTRTRALVQAQAVGARPLLERLVTPPIEAAASTSGTEVAREFAEGWCHAVHAPFQQDLAGRYPFTAAGEDATLETVQAYLAPRTGRLWAHVEGPMAALVRREGERFVLQPSSLGAQGMRSTVPLYLERAQRVTSSFFGAGDAITLPLRVRILASPGIARTRLRVGATHVEYRNGPELVTTVAWPGSAPESGASLEVTFEDGSFERLEEAGDWGLLRLLESSARIAGGGRRFVAIFGVGPAETEVRIEFETDRPGVFFAEGDRRARFLGPLRDLAPPARSMNALPPCGE